MSGTQILWKKERATNLTVRLVQGISTLQYLNLRAGSSVGPLRVGSAADWCVSGEGVQPIHLSLLFDGTDLFAAAVSPTVYVSVNGQPLNAGQWVPVGISSEICFGSAVLHVARGESQPPAGAAGLQIPPAETGPEATLSDGGRLREIAQRALDAAGDTVSAPPPPIGSPSAPPPAMMPTPVPAAGQPPPPAATGASAPPPGVPAKTKSGSSWGETSLVKKLTLFLLPLAAVGTWFTWDDPAPQPKKAKRNAPVASASAPAKSANGFAKTSPPSSAAVPRTEAPAGSSASAALGSAAPPTSAALAASAAPAGANEKTAPPGSAGVLMIAPGSSDTTPRAAIDAAFAGRLETAKELYAKLAAAHPDKPEYALAKKRVEENAVRKP